MDLNYNLYFYSIAITFIHIDQIVDVNLGRNKVLENVQVTFLKHASGHGYCTAWQAYQRCENHLQFQAED
jgi:hypothetical protein